jgi:hypothetical protein
MIIGDRNKQVIKIEEEDFMELRVLLVSVLIG